MARLDLPRYSASLTIGCNSEPTAQARLSAGSSATVSKALPSDGHGLRGDRVPHHGRLRFAAPEKQEAGGAVEPKARRRLASAAASR